MTNGTRGPLVGQQAKTHAELLISGNHFCVPKIALLLHILSIEDSTKPKKFPSSILDTWMKRLNVGRKHSINFLSSEQSGQ